MSSIDRYAQFISRQQKTLESDGKLISEREVLINRLMAEGYTLEQIEFMIREKIENIEDFEGKIIDARISTLEKPLRKASKEMVDDPKFRSNAATRTIKKDIPLKSTLPDTVSKALAKIDLKDADASLRRNPRTSSLTSQPSSTQTNDDWRFKMANIKAKEADASIRRPSAPTSDKNGSPTSIGGPASTQTNQKQNLAAVARQAAIDVPADVPGIKYPDPKPLTPKESADAPKPVFSNPPPANRPPANPPRRSHFNAVLDNRLVGKDTSDAIGGKPPEPAKGYPGSIPTRTKGPPVSVENPDALAKTLQAKQTPSPAQGARAAAEIVPGEGRKPAAASSAPAAASSAPAAAQDAKPTARPAASQSRPAPSAKGEYGPSGYDPTATRERRWEGNKIVRVEKPTDFRKTVFDR